VEGTGCSLREDRGWARILLEKGNCLSWMTAKRFHVDNRMKLQLKFQRGSSLRDRRATPSQGKAPHLKLRRIRLKGMFYHFVTSTCYEHVEWGADNVWRTKTQSQTTSRARSFKGDGTLHAHRERRGAIHLRPKPLPHSSRSEPQLVYTVAVKLTPCILAVGNFTETSET
jgi:hypothetical protein